MRWILLAGCAAMAFGQGTEPKAKVDDYEVTAVSKNIKLGAEYMVHSFGSNGQMFFTEDFLVAEVALYPPKGQTVDVKLNAFSLRLNGKKETLSPVTPSMVAASLNRRPWGYGPQGGGGGNPGVTLGGPVPSQIPGGPGRIPAPPRAPSPDAPGGIDRPEPVRPEELVVQTALPGGEARGPVSGFLYFAFKGKPASRKSVDLLYEDVVLKLR